MVDRLVEWHRATSTTRSLKKNKRRVTDKQRIRSKLYNLSLDINTLRQQIQDLHLHRNLLYTRQLYTKCDGDGSLVRRTDQFIQVAQGGYTTSAQEVRDFFTTVFHENISFGFYRGRDQLAVTARYNYCWNSVTTMQVDTIRMVSTDPMARTFSVHVEGVARGNISLDAIKFLYPAVLKYPALANSLVNKRWHIPIKMLIEFDEQNQIVRQDPELNFVEGLNELVGDATLAAQLIQEAAEHRTGLIYAMSQMEQDMATRTDRPHIEELYEFVHRPLLFDERQSVDFLLSTEHEETNEL